MFRDVFNKFTMCFGYVVPASMVLSVCDLVVGTALSMMFGNKAKLKIRGR